MQTENLDLRVINLENELEIYKEQNRLVWGYLAEVTVVLNNIKKDLDQGFLPHFCPDQKSLTKFQK